MIPLLKLAWAYRKIAGAILAILAISVLAWRIHAWREGYLARNAAVKALAVEKQAHDADLLRVAQQQEQDAKERAKLAMNLDAIRAKFDNLPVPPPKTLIRTVEVPVHEGQTTCPSPRVSPDFVRVWNDSGTP